MSESSALIKILKETLAITGLFGLVILAGCAPRVVERPPRFFWPPLPNEPRIEFVDYFLVEEDLDRDRDTWLRDAILGKDLPVPLFKHPTDVASDGRRVMVVDATFRRVRVLDRTTKKLRNLVDPNGDQFAFSAPYGVTIDQYGNAYVTDTVAKKILVFGPDEAFVKVIGADRLSRPTGLAVDSERNRLYVVDTAEHRLVVFDLNGQHLFDWGSRGPGQGTFNFPTDVDVDVDGKLYVLDSMNAKVQVLDHTGEFLREFGERGTALGSFQVPKAIAVAPAGLVFVTDSMAKRFVIFDTMGEYLLTIGGRQRFAGSVNPGGFYLPMGIDADQNNTIWVVDALNCMLQQYQYLTEQYLESHPIEPGEAFLPRLDDERRTPRGRQ